VNSLAYTHDRLRQAISANKDGRAPVQLQIKFGDEYRTIPIDYRGGLRYPRLERDEATPARLDDILKAR
jgi:hypothetical protein